MMKDNQIAVFYHFFEKDKIYKQNLIFSYRQPTQKISIFIYQIQKIHPSN